MATLIKDTPILYGKDAERFRAEIAKAKKVSPEVRERIINTYNKIKEANPQFKW